MSDPGKPPFRSVRACREPASATAPGLLDKLEANGAGFRRVDRFADAARVLAGLAGALLGWRPGEFWAATPEEFATVIQGLSGARGPQAGADDLAHLMEMFPDG